MKGYVILDSKQQLATRLWDKRRAELMIAVDCAASLVEFSFFSFPN